MQQTTEVRRARDIYQKVERRIVEWRKGWYQMMAEDTTRTRIAMISKVARVMSEETISKTFSSLVLKGKIRTAARFVTLQGAGDVLSSDDTNPKSERLVTNVFWQKHPAPIVPTVQVLEHYKFVPELVPLDVTKDTIEKISGRLTGADSPGEIDAAGLQQ